MNRTLLSIFAGLGGMFGWGTSDFFANIASGRVGHTKTFFWSQIAGLALIVLCVAFVTPSFAIAPALLGMSIFCGIAYALGYLLFYKGFEIGNVSVVSAVINLQILFIVLISFFLRGQPLAHFQLLAIALIIIGVTLISLNFNELRKGSVSLLKGVKETIASAVIFGVFYWPLNEFVVEKADWLAISLITKLTAVTFIILQSFVIKKPLGIQKPAHKLIALLAAVGILEAVAVLSATFGQSYGDGIIVAPISSALTIVTVALAIVFLKEKLTKIQAFGIILTVGGILLTAL